MLLSLGDGPEIGSLHFEDKQKPRLDMCMDHQIPHTFFFPHLIRAKLANGTSIDSNDRSPCWMVSVLSFLIFFI